MSVVLVGYRGSGKSSVGRKLADSLWLPLIDTDERIVAQAGMSIREIFQRQGEEAFRDLESAVVMEACAGPEAVIALGGGAVLRESNRTVLKSHKVIYLRCDEAVLAQRIAADPGSGINRPNLTSLGGGLEEVRQVLAVREPIYRQCATAELDVTNLSVDEAAARIVKLI